MYLKLEHNVNSIFCLFVLFIEKEFSLSFNFLNILRSSHEFKMVSISFKLRWHWRQFSNTKRDSWNFISQSFYSFSFQTLQHKPGPTQLELRPRLAAGEQGLHQGSQGMDPRKVGQPERCLLCHTTSGNCFRTKC